MSLVQSTDQSVCLNPSMNHSSEIDLNFDVLTLNVKGLRDYRKRRKIFNYIKKHILPEGIFFLQETHSLKQDEGLCSAQFRGTLKFSHGTNDSVDVLIGFSENLDFTIEVSTGIRKEDICC